MKMAASRTTGGAHEADQVAALDARIRINIEPGHVAVTGLDAVTVVDFNIFAVTAEPLRAADNTVSCCINRSADRTGHIEALVTGATAFEGIGTVTIRTGQSEVFHLTASCLP